jgi:hypothetical protein
MKEALEQVVELFCAPASTGCCFHGAAKNARATAAI